MILTAQQKFAIPYIQAIIRGYLARKLCKQMRSVRLIQDYYKFKLHFRVYVSKLKVLQKSFFFFLVSKKMIKYAIKYRSATRLQKWYHKYYLLRKAIIKVTSIKLWNHIELFSITRAKKTLIPIEKYRYILYKFMRSYIYKQRRRR